MTGLTTRIAHAIVLIRITHRLVSGYLLIRLIWPFMDPRAREASVQRWCRGVLGVLGVKLSAAGHPFPERDGDGLLLISNHISWVDAVAIHALVPCGFLAKASLRGWPIVGHLIERTGGVFVQRGNPFDLKRALDAMAAALASGQSICVFPEGTTTEGTTVGPFSTLVFELAAQRGAGVLPMALRYFRHGKPTQIPAWVGDEAFLPSLWRVVGSDGLTVEVIAGERLAHVADRAHAAEQAREAVAALLGVPLSAESIVVPQAAEPQLGTVATPQIARIAEAARAWIAAERRLQPPQIADQTSLRSLGIDSLALLELVVELEKRLGLRVDESKLELSSNATVLELSTAMARSER